jgi:uncharacterized protein (TIGR02099 family)
MLPRPALLWLNRLVWTVLVGAVVLGALIVSFGRHALPYVESHRQQLVDEFNRRSDLHLSIGHISAQWQRLSPRFVIDDLRLYNPKNPSQVVVRVAHAELQLGLFRSVDARTLAISRLRGSGVNVQLQEVAPGHWRLPGFEPQGDSNTDALIDFLLAIYRASISDVRIDLQFAGGAQTHVVGNSLQLQRAGNFRRLNLGLSVADQVAPVTLLVESHGDPRHAGSFAARGYTALRGVDLAPLLPAARGFGVLLQHGFIDGETWFDWRSSGRLEMRGRVALPQLDIAGFAAEALPPITALNTEFLLRSEGEQRQLWVPQLSATWSGVKLDLQQLLFSASGANPDLYQLAMPAVELAPLRDALLAGSVLSDHARGIVAALEPRGTLRNVRLDLPLGQEPHAQLRLRAQLEQIALRAWEDAPGVGGAGGYVDAHLHDGVLDLSSDAFAIEFPHVYHEPLHFDRVRGQIGWRTEDDRVLVNSGPIAVQSDAGEATAQTALDLPLHAGGRPLMTLLVGLRNSAAQYHNRFVPYTLPPDLLAWLQRAVRSGNIPLGGFLYRGSLRSHESAERSVQLFLDVRDGELAYQPDWPPLHDLEAGVWLDDDDLLVRAPSARMFDTIEASDVFVELRHPPSGSWLTVRGAATGSGADVLRLLHESPLHKQVGTTLDTWRWHGRARAQLDLGIPIGGTRPAELRVDSELSPGTLTMTGLRIALTDLRGPLNYSSAGGLQSSGLSGKWYGKPLLAKVSSAASGELTVQAVGRVGTNDLADWLQQPLFRHAEGEVPFDATLRIAGDNSAVTVRSDLVGATVLLPPPFHKEAAQPLPLDLRMSLGAQRELFAELGDWLDLRLRWDRDLLIDAGLLRLGKTGKVQLASGQLAITGHVPTFDFGPWHEVITRVNSGGPGSIGDNILAVYLRDLQFGTLEVIGQTLNNVHLSGHRDSNVWQLSLNSSQIGGQLRVPESGQQPWGVKLNYLRLPESAATPTPASTPAPASAEAPSALAQVDPTKIMPVDLTVDHLWRGNEELGSLALQLRPIDAGVQISNVSSQLRHLSIVDRDGQPASLTWTRRDGVDRSEFKARLVVGNVADVLQSWKYEPVVTSTAGQCDLALRWPGAPDQFAFARTDGEAQVRIDDGRFLKASSSASGALRVVGIFNFANFLKRLQLDFSDVFKDGVAFDDMQGGLALQQGVLRTTRPVEITSPSSHFRITGQLDFNVDQTDLELVATLPAATNLPWIAALAGGLPAAAGVFVASKVFENQVDKLASVTYQLSGPIADPHVGSPRKVKAQASAQKVDTQKSDKKGG